jgi:hypothetical protein
VLYSLRHHAPCSCRHRTSPAGSSRPASPLCQHSIKKASCKAEKRGTRRRAGLLGRERVRNFIEHHNHFCFLTSSPPVFTADLTFPTYHLAGGASRREVHDADGGYTRNSTIRVPAPARHRSPRTAPPASNAGRQARRCRRRGRASRWWTSPGAWPSSPGPSCAGTDADPTC